MADRPLRFAVVGPGAVARVHAMAIQQARGAELVAVCGRNEGATAAFAACYDIAASTNLDALLGSQDIDAITIAAPSGRHLDIGTRAAFFGKHVLCEKPLEITTERAQSLIEACNRHDVSLGVIFQARFDPCTLLVKDAISSGRLGRLLFASCQMRWYRRQEYYDSGEWRGTQALDGGGCLMNQGIHTLDLLLHLVGTPVEIAAFQGPVTHQRIEVEDNLAAIVRYANGAIGSIEASTSCAPGFPRRIEISGDQGSIGIEDNRIVRWQFAEEQPQDHEIRLRIDRTAASVGGAADPTAIDVTGHRLVVEDFVRSVAENRQPFIGGPEGKKSVDFVCAAYAAMRFGKVIRLA